METIKKFITKYYEQLAYLFFGGLATLLNVILFAVFQLAFGTGFASGVGNVIDNIICILFAYWTNRTFVFRSRSRGKAALKEFGQFILFRLLTLVMDQVIITLGVQLIGPALGFAARTGASAADAVAPSDLWAMGVKLFSQVAVILSNYVFSKLFTFKKH